MKKFLLISILLGVIIFSGCGKQWPSQKELFDKKQECVNYKNAIEKDITDSIAKDNDWKTLKKLGVTIYIEDIFYSSRRNSCLYIYNNQNNGYSNHFLVDYLTKEFIMWYGENLSSPEYIAEFKEKVRELKWE